MTIKCTHSDISVFHTSLPLGEMQMVSNTCDAGMVGPSEQDLIAIENNGTCQQTMYESSIRTASRLSSVAHHAGKNCKHRLNSQRMTTACDVNDSVRIYMKEIAKYDLLDADDEVRLGTAIKDGLQASYLLAAASAGKVECTLGELRVLSSLVEHGLEAKRELVEANLRLVVSVAKRYTASGMTLLDIIQEGNLGLMAAADRFDPDLGYRFSTYAIWWIRHAITRGIANKNLMIRLPAYKGEAVAKLACVQRKLTQSLGREATLQEIGEEMGMTASRVLEIRELNKEIVSLDQPIGNKNESLLGDYIEDENAVDPFSNVYVSLLHERISYAFEYLTDREARVLTMSFGLDNGEKQYSLKEIGEEFGLSYERVRQIKETALEKLSNPCVSRLLEGLIDEE